MISFSCLCCLLRLFLGQQISATDLKDIGHVREAWRPKNMWVGSGNLGGLPEGSLPKTQQ